LPGQWAGLVTDYRGSRPLYLNIGDDAKATLDSPNRHSCGERIVGLAQDGPQVAFTLPAEDESFAGTLSNDGSTISGVWAEPSGRVPVSFGRPTNARFGPRPSRQIARTNTSRRRGPMRACPESTACQLSPIFAVRNSSYRVGPPAPSARNRAPLPRALGSPAFASLTGR